MPLPLGPTRPTRIPLVMTKLRSVRSGRCVVEVIGEAFDFDEALALASGGGEVEFGAGGAGAGAQIAEFADEFVGAVDARFGFATAGFGAAAEPLDFGVDAVFEGFLMAGLGVHPLLFHFEEVGVGAGDAEDSVGIDAGEFGGFVGHVFKKIAVVGDDDAGEAGLRREAVRATRFRQGRGGWWARRGEEFRGR